jgi:hypothetical protein
MPTIVADRTYVEPAPPGTVFYRDVPAGHYDITIPNPSDFDGSSAHFDLMAGQQAFVKVVFWKTGHDAPRTHTQGFSALLVPEQVAQAELANMIPDGRQR